MTSKYSALMAVVLGCVVCGCASHQRVSPAVRITTAESITDDERLREYVACVAGHLVARSSQLPTEQYLHIHIRDDDRINATAVTRDRIDLYTGLIDVTENDDQLAAVIAHELAHQVLGHPARRKSLAYATDTGKKLASDLSQSGPVTETSFRALFQAGWRASTLPLRRSQENHADRLGLELSANAGFDPAASIALWNNLDGIVDDKYRPAFAAHPRNERRIAQLKKHVTDAKKIQVKAIRSGADSDCAW